MDWTVLAQDRDKWWATCRDYNGSARGGMGRHGLDSTGSG